MKSKLRHVLYRLALGAAFALRDGVRKRYSLGILKLDHLGDAVLALGAVRHLLRFHREADTLLVVSPIAEPLFRAEFPAAGILTLPAFCRNFAPDYVAFLFRHGRAVTALEVDQLVCLRHQPSDYLTSVAQLLGPRQGVCSLVEDPWEKVCLRFPAGGRVPYPWEYQGMSTEIEAHRRVVELALGQPVALADVMPVITCAEPNEGKSLMLCPLAGDAIRTYPARYFVEAVRLILARHNLPVEVCLPPGADEAPWRAGLDADGIVCQTWHRPADAVALCGVLAGAGVVLANDSAPAHIATALNKRGVFLLGGGHPGMFAPWTRSDRQRWLKNPMDCYGCRWNCIHPQPYCITKIAPATIAEAVDQILAAD